MKKSRNNADAPLVDPMAGRLGYQLRRASVQMMADLGAHLAPTGLRPAEVTILLLIAANAGCRQGEIGQMLGIQRANMVPLIAGLVRGGLVVRARADGRSHALSLTPAGISRAAELGALLDQHEAQFRARLSNSALAGVLDSLVKLRG